MPLCVRPGEWHSSRRNGESCGPADEAVRWNEEEHRIAVELQRGLVPKRLPEVTGIELAAHYQAAGAANQVGGDWYDAFALPGGRLGVVLGDVAGKGIPAASTMGQLRSVTRAFALADDGGLMPGEVLTRLNRFQLAQGEDELFTVIYVIVDPQSERVAWASAGALATSGARLGRRRLRRRRGRADGDRRRALLRQPPAPR